ncbi:MAG: PilZ domain-containing protein [Desulfobulbaceae bacterium]|nr:PilZ domain-containing protein [Desulfobulbaceae bacterium]
MEKNTITLNFSKILTKKELDTIYTDVRFAVADLKPGFNVISDFSQTKLLFLNGLGVFRKIFNFILSSDSGEIIRVIQDNRIIHKQLLNLSLQIPGYVPIYSPSIEEAEAKINQTQKRNGLRFNVLQHPVEFNFGGQKHTGTIINISTSGSAIMTNKVQPEINSVVEIKFSLQDQKKQSNNFSIKAKVVRTESYVFAVTFMDVDEANKNNLWNCIIASGS